MAMGLLIVIAILYFVPAMIACNRKSKYSAGVVWLNLILGWTFIGWVAAFIWAWFGKEE